MIYKTSASKDIDVLYFYVNVIFSNIDYLLYICKNNYVNMPKKYQKIDRTNISKRLIHLYPDSILTTSDGDLDFENTLYNFATNIIDNLSDRRMQIFFNRMFDNIDDVYDYLINNVLDLRELLEQQINNKEDGD